MASEPVVSPEATTDVAEPAAPAATEPVSEPNNDTGTQQADPGTADPSATSPAATPAPEESFITEDQLRELGVENVEAFKATGAYKGMQAAFTKKTQAIAARKQLLDTFETNPHGTVIYLANKLGIPLAQAQQVADDAKAQAQAGAPAPSADPQAELRASLAEEFGESAADKILQVGAAMAEARVAPLRQQSEIAQRHAVQQEVQKTLDRFDNDYPDWRQFEQEMVQLGQAMPMRPGADRYEYMKALYKAHNYDRALAKGTLAKQQKEAAAEANSTPSTGQSGPAVQQGAVVAPKFSSINAAVEAAFEAAKAGKTFARR
jgi:hypothetical protein